MSYTLVIFDSNRKRVSKATLFLSSHCHARFRDIVGFCKKTATTTLFPAKFGDVPFGLIAHLGATKSKASRLIIRVPEVTG